ncbi:MAG: PepSY domain-containing protein [Cellvibrionaceae bacterium]|nr:PepSY domain-containing protein [Cellvibrionaceae bacterium]
MRKTLFKVHSYLALVALLPLLVIAATGSVLVFKSELDALLLPGVAQLDHGPSASRRNINHLVALIKAELPEYEIGTWELFDDGFEADRVFLLKRGTADWYKVHLDPYEGRVLDGPQPLNSQLSDWLVQLHFTLLLNDLNGEHSQFGTLVGLVAAVLLMVLGITGLILHRKFWRNLLRLRWRQSARVFNGDLHRLVGAWSSPVVLVLGFTGAYFNTLEFYYEGFAHDDNGHAVVTGSLVADSVDFEAMIETSKKQLAGFIPSYLMLPYEPALQLTLFGYQPGRNPLASKYASAITFDHHSGELLQVSNGKNAPALAKVTDSFRELHFGSFGGLPIKIVWSVLGFMPVILAASGAYLWWRRTRTRAAKSAAAIDLHIKRS